MERRDTGPKSSSYGQACVQCSKAKCRCITRPDSDGCERCFRLKKPCQPSAAVRRRGAQNHEAGEQIAKLEGKVEALTSMLQSVVKTPGASADLTSKLDQPSSTASVDGSYINTFNDEGAWQTPLDPFLADGSSQPLPTPPSEPRPDEADGYINYFRERMLPHFPFVYISPGMTAWNLRKDRPLLFQAIVAVATPSTQLKMARIERLKYGWAESAVLEIQSSTDMLLSILTYIAWSIDPFVKRTSSLSRMMMLAISLLYDLQRARQPPAEAHVIATIAPGFEEANWGVSETSATDFLELQRAGLACFVLSSIISSYFRRTDAVRWTPQMEEGLHRIEMNKNCPSDKAFAVQVRLQLLAQKVAQVRERQETDGNDILTPSAIPPAPASLYLGLLQRQLQELKASFSPDLEQIYLLTAYAHYVDLCMNEMTGLATSSAPVLTTPESAGHVSGDMPGFGRLESLWRCLHAAKSWLDVFYTLTPAAYVGLPFFYWFQLVRCLVILKHLSTFEDPAWNCQAVHDAVDMLHILDWMAEKAELASKEAGEQSEDDLFQQVSRMLRISQAWVNAKRKAATQATEGLSSNHIDGPTSATTGDVVVNSSPAAWMSAFEAGDNSWFEEFLGWSPGTL